jgi:predicted nuclease of restriction endonuclease-like (RecB) superfamily
MNTSKNDNNLPVPTGVDLLERVVSILDQARTNAIRTVNNQMLLAYWLIGREIVQVVQDGDQRAKYGDKVTKKLSQQLTEKYGRGFSTTNIRYFRSFYLCYAKRQAQISTIIPGDSAKRHMPCGVFEISAQIDESTLAFSPNLGWSHYRTLMGISNDHERLFYEIEAEKESWSVEHLKRQIHTFLFARLIKSKDQQAILEDSSEKQLAIKAADLIKDPYILDFLSLPDSKELHESDVESAIIDNLQQFLLELGKGFAFVGRQKRMQFDSDFFYIDLVFYNCILKCYLLIDLKIGALTHQDVGQMDSYVRMFDDKYITEGDKPTIGLILCAEKNETIAKYSVLKDSEQLFASKYMLYLPSEEEFAIELAREHRLVEEQLKINEKKGDIEG